MPDEPARSRFAEAGAKSHMRYETRVVRFALMHSMRNGLPPYDRRFSLQEIANEMVALGYERLSRERVRQILDAPPQRRQVRAAPNLRRAELERRVKHWEARGTRRALERAERYRVLLRDGDQSSDALLDSERLDGDF
jgi:hypothetical protein